MTNSKKPSREAGGKWPQAVGRLSPGWLSLEWPCTGGVELDSFVNDGLHTLGAAPSKAKRSKKDAQAPEKGCSPSLNGSIFQTRAVKDRNYFLRWRIRARMRRFLRPILRRPFPVFFTPTSPTSRTVAIRYTKFYLHLRKPHSVPQSPQSQQAVLGLTLLLLFWLLCRGPIG